MKTVTIGKDERYPDYYMSAKPDARDETVEISDELYDELRAADQVYSAAQIKMAALYEKQK